MTAILLCSEDIVIVIPESPLSRKAELEKLFQSHERKFLPTEFKQIDILCKWNDIFLSQMG